MVRCRRAWADATQRRPDSRTAALDGELARSVSPHILRVHAIVLRVRVPGILFRGNDVEIGHSAGDDFVHDLRSSRRRGDARARLFVKADGLIALSSTLGSFWTLQKDKHRSPRLPRLRVAGRFKPDAYGGAELPLNMPVEL
jgi:hypothetical protein